MNPVTHSRLLAVATAAAASQMSFMTGEEGSELVTLGYIVPNPSVPGPVPGSCAVSITAAGYQALQAMVPAPAAPPVVQAPAPAVKPVIGSVRTGIAIPAPLKRGGKNNLVPRKSMYPFDSLAEPAADGSCASFHVAQTADNPEPWKAVASNVSAANSRSGVPVTDPATGQPVMETVVKKTAVKGADGKAIKGQYAETTVTQPKLQATKKFIARRVSSEDPDGPGVRVFRVPLNFE